MTAIIISGEGKPTNFAVLLHILEVSGSNPELETGCSELCASWVSLDSPRMRRDIASNYTATAIPNVLYNSLFINDSIIRRYKAVREFLNK